MKPEQSPRLWAVTVVLALLLGAALWTPAYQHLFIKGPLHPLDRQAEEKIDQAFKRSVACYALARATRSVVSIVEERAAFVTEEKVRPGAVSLSLGDLLDRFSWAMLASSTALGAQKFVLGLGQWLSVRVVLVVGAALFLTGLWSGESWAERFSNLGGRLILMALLLRLALPLAVLINHALFEHFLAGDYALATTQLEQGRHDLATLTPGEARRPLQQESGFWSALKGSGETLKALVDFDAQLDWVKRRAAALTDHLMTLIVVFFLNTLVLPLLLLWGLWRTGRLFFCEPMRRQTRRFRRAFFKTPHPSSKEVSSCDT